MMLRGLVLGVVVLGTGAGCGGSDNPTAPRASDSPEQVVERLRTGIGAGDWEAVCALGTPQSVERIESESDGSCPNAFESTADEWQAALPPAGIPAPEVDVNGDQATVTHRWKVEGVSTTGRVNLESVDGRWLIDLYEL